MEITKTYDWNRRDFSYDEKCESCDHTETGRRGYDDDNYYRNVQPARKCSQCDKTTLDYETETGSPVKRVVPEYPADQVI